MNDSENCGSIGFYGSSGDDVSFSFPEVYSIDSLTQNYNSDEQRSQFIKWLASVSSEDKENVECAIERKRGYHLNMKAYVDNSESIWENGKEVIVAKHESILAIENDIGYIQFCQSREEINEFIKRLEQVRDAVWTV